MKDSAMTSDVVDTSWMDEQDPDGIACVKCDVELEARGKTCRAAIRDIAAALRSAATLIENGMLDEDGFHDLTSLGGEKMGEVYLDYTTEVSV
jgi:hypothetical protein